MVRSYKWRITLADDSVKNEGTDSFNLSWEANNAVKTAELIGSDGETDTYKLDFSNGKFYKNSVEIDAGIADALNIYYRRRNQVRVDETGTLPLGTQYILGYKNVSGNYRIMDITPIYTVGQTGPTSFTVSFRNSP